MKDNGAGSEGQLGEPYLHLSCTAGEAQEGTQNLRCRTGSISLRIFGVKFIAIEPAKELLNVTLSCTFAPMAKRSKDIERCTVFFM